MSLGVEATRDCLPPADSRSRPLCGAAETPGEQPARCAWAEIHVQTNAKDRGKQYAREWARRTLPVCMSDGTRSDTGHAQRRSHDHEVPHKGRAS